MLAKRNILVIDVGGHRAKAAIVSPNERSIEKLIISTYPSVKQNPAVYKGSVGGRERISCALRLLRKLYTPEVECIAISSTGITDMDSGVIIRETSSSYQGTNWPEVLISSGLVRSSVRLLVVNDAWSGAWWEFHGVDSTKDRSVSVRVTVGSGVGSGIVIDGSLFRSASWVAGEIAYVPFRPQDGVECPHGRGCVEAYASASGVIREFCRIAASTPNEWYRDLLLRGNVNLRDVKQACQMEVPGAAAALRPCGEALGTAIGVVLNLLGPTTVAVGGSVIEMLPGIFDIAKQAAGVIGLRAAFAACDVRKAYWKDREAVLLGAAALAAKEARPLASYGS